MTSHPTMQALYTMAARPCGVSAGDAARAYGLDPDMVYNRLENMVATGRLTRRRVKQGGKRLCWHFFADPSVPWSAAERKAKARIAAKIEEAKQRIARAITHGKDRPIGAKARRTTRMIDGRRVPVTIGPCSPDMRFHVKQVREPYFGNLAIGSYLPSDTAISRASI